MNKIVLAVAIVGSLGTLRWTSLQGERPSRVNCASSRVRDSGVGIENSPLPRSTPTGTAHREVAEPPERRWTFLGRVLESESEQGIAGAEVILLEEADDAWPGSPARKALRVRTDALGRFLFEDSAREWGTVLVQASGHGARMQRLMGSSDPWSMTLPAANTVLLSTECPLLGRVIDSSGKPVGGAEVSAWVTAPGDGQASPVRRGVSNYQGRFQIAELESGHVWICVRAPGWPVLARTHELDRGQAGLELVLRPGVRIDGTVLLDGRPAAGVEVRASACSWARSGSASSNLDGSFCLEGIPEGPCDLTFSSPRTGEELGVRQLALTRDEDRHLKVEFTSAQRISLKGNVRVNGAPPSTGYVELRPVPIRSGERPTYSAASSLAPLASSGAFSAEGLPSGAYLLSLSATLTDGTRVSHEQRVYLDGADLELDLHLGCASATVAWQVSGVPVRDVGVWLERRVGEEWIPVAGPSDEVLTSDVNGRFTIPWVVPGEYRVHCPGRAVEPGRAFLVTAGCSTDLGVALLLEPLTPSGS